MQAKIISTGSYLPQKSVDNSYFSYLDTSNEWIVQHTGIKQRYIASAQETTCYMAYEAAHRAISAVGISCREIDLIIVATTTNDNIFPSCAASVQKMLGCVCPAFDVQAVCAGFVFAVATAFSYIKSGMYQNVMVIGVEKMSSIVDWQDRKTCVLFGDGAGAVIMQKTDDTTAINAFELNTDGSYADILYTPIQDGIMGKLAMNGQAVFRHAVDKLSLSFQNVLKKANKSLEDVSWFVPHQANLRIMDAVLDRISLPTTKCVATVSMHANTSAASVPLALDYANKNKMFNTGDLVVCSAIGAGLCWGSILFTW